MSCSERYTYRVELGKHSLKASEDGSVSLTAAEIITHEDYNIFLSRYYCSNSSKRSSTSPPVANEGSVTWMLLFGLLQKWHCPHQVIVPCHLIGHHLTCLSSRGGCHSGPWFSLLRHWLGSTLQWVTAKKQRKQLTNTYQTNETFKRKKD